MNELMLKISDSGNRKQEVMDFFGYPQELVDTLFKYSKEYFEGIWDKFYPDNVDYYYGSGFYTIRQMSYSKETIFDGETIRWLNEIKGSCLDYGCGVGDNLIYLAKQGVECYAVEHNGLPAEFLKWRFKRYDVDIEILPQDSLTNVEYTLLMSALDHINEPINFTKKVCVSTRKQIFAKPCIDETYDRPTHIKAILKDVPEAFRLINEHNERTRNLQ